MLSAAFGVRGIGALQILLDVSKPCARFAAFGVDVGQFSRFQVPATA